MVATCGWDPSWSQQLPPSVDAPLGSTAMREQLWRQWRDVVGDKDDDEAWSPVFGLRLTPEEMTVAARHAELLATCQQVAPGAEQVWAASRRLGPDRGSRRPGAGRPSFEDLVLPAPTLAAVREVVAWARARDRVLAQGPLTGKGDKGRGLAALFSGSPGTGKTLAAHVIAGELGLDLHTVDLSAVVDKYIGETEKNLERVFAEAEAMNVLLFFDEADALFGARSAVRDSRDRYANQGVAYLLQRIEQFDGLVVLATNLRGNLDVAFMRRLHFVVHFPDPDVTTRQHLWTSHLLPVQPTDPHDPVDVEHLAETLDLAGGDIRNVVLAAAFGAASEDSRVGMRHVLRAVLREHRKLGRRLPVPGLRTVEEAVGPTSP